MDTLKRTFYPLPEVERVFRKAPPKKASHRINELILKGLEWEKEAEIVDEYRKYNQAAGELLSRQEMEAEQASSLKDAEALFADEDETEDWY